MIDDPKELELLTNEQLERLMFDQITLFRRTCPNSRVRYEHPVDVVDDMQLGCLTIYFDGFDTRADKTYKSDRIGFCSSVPAGFKLLPNLMAQLQEIASSVQPHGDDESGFEAYIVPTDPNDPVSWLRTEHIFLIRLMNRLDPVTLNHAP